LTDTEGEKMPRRGPKPSLDRVLAVSTSIRSSEREHLLAIAAEMGRTPTFVIASAIRHYMEHYDAGEMVGEGDDLSRKHADT
jgi:hypothetical protein